jgi:hypothetical protein
MMDELVKDFLVESNENLDCLDKELVQLESASFRRFTFERFPNHSKR